MSNVFENYNLNCTHFIDKEIEQQSTYVLYIIRLLMIKNIESQSGLQDKTTVLSMYFTRTLGYLILSRKEVLFNSRRKWLPTLKYLVISFYGLRERKSRYLFYTFSNIPYLI